MLQVVDLQVVRGHKRVLDGINLDVLPGQVLGVLGPNAVSYTHLTLPTILLV